MEISILLPYEHLIIDTYLSTEQAWAMLAEAIEPKKMFRWFLSGDHKPYQGQLHENGFEVTRIIHYRNSFLPVIKGRIRPNLGGSTIDIRMYPHPLVIVFMVIWLSGAGFGACALFSNMLVSLLQSNKLSVEFLLGLVLPAGFLLFGYGLFWGGFKFESLKSRAFFQDLFKDISPY